ncbi:Solute carrier family 25 member 46 [Nymphon striatum]|nr:Solute carrier family 25 member 46 [Nymphon striatum]
MAGSIPDIRTERVLQFNEENRDWMKERNISEELRPPKNLLSVPHHSRQPDLEEVNRFAGMGSSLLKLASTVITTFISANLVETVQSDIASEKPGAFDFMKEGFFRIFKWKTVQTTRLLPVWVLAIPTLTYHIARSIEQEESFKAMPSEFDYYYTEIIATCMAHFMSDVLLYPLETILHRLYLQGTRTIIDNLDSGLSVVPIISRYEGMMDCFHSILDDEGIYGFYRGFGALIVQYALQLFILKGIKRVLNDISEFSKSEN